MIYIIKFSVAKAPTVNTLLPAGSHSWSSLPVSLRARLRIVFCLLSSQSRINNCYPQGWPSQLLEDLFKVSKRITFSPFFPRGGINPSATRNNNMRGSEYIYGGFFSSSSNLQYLFPSCPSPACSWTDSHPHFWKVFSMDIAFYLLHNIKMSPLFVLWHE